jgi:hypothetical protein
MVGTLLITIWGLLVCVSQYFLDWHVFASGGLTVIGVIGLIGFILWLLGNHYRTNPNPNVPKWF